LGRRRSRVRGPQALRLCERRGAPYAGQAHRLRASIWDDSPDDRSFAEHRGFTERSHALAMTLDLHAMEKSLVFCARD